jgi:hypothetical protein
MTTMSDREIALKAACVQAAATMIAARDTGKEGLDVVREECARQAVLLYARVAKIDWNPPA